MEFTCTHHLSRSCRQHYWLSCRSNYQPQLNIKTNSVVGAEALVRWKHTDGTLIPTDKFVPLAEETGLIQPLGEWVLRESCRQMRIWKESGIVAETTKLFVNLSVKQLQQHDLVERVLEILKETAIEPSMLELEITESFIMQHPEKSAETFRKLRSYGIDLSVDDFGTGYSSLSYLKGLPITKLKIDRSFVRDIPEDANDEAIAKAVIALGKSLQLKVVAEGVETEEQCRFLQQEGCDYGQGYLYSRPLPANEFEAYLKALKV
ncbi:MAG: EAL domain-containing protein [Pseudomonadota bacterium]